MARPGLLQHRKFRRLARQLGGRIALALGSLEMIWTSCYENGEEYLGDSDDVEAAACWEGEAGRLTQALLAAGGDGELGFIEEIPGRPGRYQVHDLWHHAPEYVQKRRRRESARRSKSDPCPPDDRETADGDRTVTGQCPDVGRQPAPDDRETADVGRHTRAQSGVTPAPAPAPAPLNNNYPLPPTGAGDPPADAGAVGEGSPPGKAKKKPKPKGRDYGIEALKLPPDVELAFDRTWKGYPQKGWDFRNKREQARRLNYAEGAARFYEILRFTDVRHDDGTAITADELADATLGFVAERQAEARRQGLPAPCVPCIANFFSSVDGQKNHWKEALLRHFGAIPEQVPA